MNEFTHNSQIFIYDYDKMTISQIEKILTLHELSVDYSQLIPTTATEHQKILSAEVKIEIYGHLLLKKIGEMTTYEPHNAIEFVRNLPAKYHSELRGAYDNFLLKQGLTSPALMKQLKPLIELMQRNPLALENITSLNEKPLTKQEQNSIQKDTKIKSLPKT